MKEAWFVWNGRKLIAKFVEHWLVACPLCGDGVVFSHNGTPHDEMYLKHEVTVASDGAMTVTPSIACPREGCTWHVVVTNGQA